MKITERQKKELVYFNEYAGEADVGELATLPLFSMNSFANRYASKVVGSLEGRRVLDLGCGWGEDTVWFAEHGARVYAVDISERMLSLAVQLASRRGVEGMVQVLKSAAESLPLGDNSFDVVFGRGTLHHVEMGAALKEVYRVLKPGGVACFVEPLADSPFINIYRWLNRSFRSPTEEPIRYRDLDIVEDSFDAFEHREFNFMALIVLVWYYFKLKLTGTFHTGWFRDLDYGLACRRAYLFFQKIDSGILGVCPRLGRWCWLTVVVGRKA